MAASYAALFAYENEFVRGWAPKPNGVIFCVPLGTSRHAR